MTPEPAADPNPKRTSEPLARRFAGLGSWLLVLAVSVAIGQTIAGSHRDVVTPTTIPAGMAVQELDGPTVDLAGQQPGIVVLNFWATWCPACRAELPELSRFASDEKGHCVSVLGVSDEDQPRLRAFVQRRPVTYPIAQSSGALEEALGVTVLPTTFILDRDGHVVQRIEGGTSATQLRELVSPLAHPVSCS